MIVRDVSEKDLRNLRATFDLGPVNSTLKVLNLKQTKTNPKIQSPGGSVLKVFLGWWCRV
jgi:hypothetical protein